VTNDHDISWRHDMALLATLIDALSTAHTDATVFETLGRVLGPRGVRVALDAGRHRARDAAGFGVEVESEAGLAMLWIAPQGPGEGAWWSPELRQALGAAVRSAYGHARALGRVATVSRKALEDKARMRADLEASYDDASLVARSGAMRVLVHDTIPLIAAQDVTVLLRGESGTGKEVLARRIHARSGRSRRVFVKINCAAIPETLAASALFGHERGAFTGAHTRHVGVFERAHGGTLLLDEVGDLPLPTQGQLLRVLQEGELERVGGSTPIRVDVRVVAATHQPLEDLVAAGRFRADLYYRLAVFPVWVPPLRERGDDVEALALALLQRHAKKLGRATPVLSPSDLARLRAHPWPGNVRELENVLLRAMVLHPDGAPGGLMAALDPPAATRVESPAVGSFADAQRAALEAALVRSGGKIYGPDGAAVALGMKPTTLRSTLDRLGIVARPGTRL